MKRSAYVFNIQNRPVRVLAVVLCAVLFLFMTAALAHSHADEPSSSSHCQICSTAHLVADPQPPALCSLTWFQVGQVALGEVSAGSRAVLVTAFIRPPPASL